MGWLEQGRAPLQRQLQRDCFCLGNLGLPSSIQGILRTRRTSSSVIALTLHANFTPFIDQLDTTFFLTLFPLPQDFHEDHEIPEDHIHFSDIRQTPTTNLCSGGLQVHCRAGPTTRPSTQLLWEPPLPDPSATSSETSLPQPPDWSEFL